jgi:hypothetical protein
MALLPPNKLSEQDKLLTLQRLDTYRKWLALDEKRYCLCCGKIITGWEIQVVGGARGMGPLRMICPTPHCESIPMDWVLPPDEVLANESILPEASDIVVTSVTSTILPAVRKKSLSARLRKFPTHLKRSTSRAISLIFAA